MQQSLKLFQQKLENQNNVIKEREKAIKQAQEDVKNAVGKSDERKQRAAIDAQLKADKKVKAKLENDKLKKEQKALTKKKNKTPAEKKRLNQIKKQIRQNNKTIGSEEELKAAQDLVGKKGLNETQITGLKEARKHLNQQMQVIDMAKKFTTITHNADGTVSIDFDYEKLEAEKMKGNISADMAQAIEDYVNGIKDASDSLDEFRQALAEDVTELYNTLTELKQQWADYEDQLIQITEESNKKELDNIKKLSDSIKKAMDDLLNDVKKKLDERRKQEDNKRTEQDIGRKQQRLAALRADTSGGHQVEIAQLEQEIADAQQNYQRSLEDQLLDKLQQQADDAQKQRERQIQLQEALLTSVNNIAQVEIWMKNPELFADEIYQAWRDAKKYDEHGEAGQTELDDQFNTFFNGLLTNQAMQTAIVDKIEEIDAEGIAEDIYEAEDKTNITSANAKSQGLNVKEAKATTGASYKELRSQAGYWSKDFADAQVSYKDARDAGFAASTLMAYDYYKDDAIKEITTDYQNFLAARGSKKSKDKNKGKLTKSDYKKQVERGKLLGYSEKKVAAQLASTDELTWAKVLKAAKGYGTKGKAVKKWYPNAKKTGSFYKAFESVYGKWSKFATGGLATSTGPAWLDGTPSRPELVLNSTDTKNFLMLKDVLASAMKGMGDGSTTYGDVTYEINISVDKIEKDYDVDRVIEKVKKEITKGAGYRNVTQVRNLR